MINEKNQKKKKIGAPGCNWMVEKVLKRKSWMKKFKVPDEDVDHYIVDSQPKKRKGFDPNSEEDVAKMLEFFSNQRGPQFE